MKKLLLLLSISLFVLTAGGCGKTPVPVTEPLPGRYAPQITEVDGYPSPYICLFEDGGFNFIDSVYSSYLALGQYHMEENRLILEVSGSERYVFTVKADNLVFEKDLSASCKLEDQVEFYLFSEDI